MKDRLGHRSFRVEKAAPVEICPPKSYPSSPKGLGLRQAQGSREDQDGKLLAEIQSSALSDKQIRLLNKTLDSGTEP